MLSSRYYRIVNISSEETFCGLKGFNFCEDIVYEAELTSFKK